MWPLQGVCNRALGALAGQPPLRHTHVYIIMYFCTSVSIFIYRYMNEQVYQNIYGEIDRDMYMYNIYYVHM